MRGRYQRRLRRRREDYSDRDATIERVSQTVRERGWTVQRTELGGGVVRINGMTINADGTTTR